MTKKTETFINASPPAADAEFYNIHKDEMNNVIAIDGSSVDATGLVNNQEAQSIKAYVSQAGILCTDSGSSPNSYILTASSPFTNPPLKTGTRVRFKTANANTGSSTITPFGGSAITCKKSNGSTDLTTGDIPANTEVEFVYNGTNFVQSLGKVPATTTTQGVAYLSNPITISNNVGSPNDTIDFGAGSFITSAGNQIYLPAISKKIQSTGTFTAGSGNNGLDTGARTASTFYRTYVIQNNSTGAYDILFSPSSTSPTVPSGYTNLGIMDYAMIRVNGSTNISPSKWHPNDKRLVLGSGESIQVFSSTAGSGNVLIVNTTEPLIFEVRVGISLTGAGGSDITVYGSEQSALDGYDTVQAVTNNGFTAVGGGSVFTSDGKIYWKNFSTVGGVSNQTCKIKSIKIRS